MAADKIAALKMALGARTELELAAMLGLSRSTISTWKKRGGVPARYLAMLEAGSGSSDAAAAGQQVFRRPDAHYWLRSALALLPEGRDGDGVLATGSSREKLVIALMGLAIRVARTDLKRQAIRNDADWAHLMECLVSIHRDAVIAVLTDHGASPSADVLNGVLKRDD
ncbi:MAG: helix-turn-helix domain-containing protein [Phenylobacterium sp.]